jgi:Arc/MetJ family transcription regulator
MASKRIGVRTDSPVRRTSLNLDIALVARARGVLGTGGTTDTVHRALEEVVLREGRRRAAALRFDHVSAEEWERIRRWGPEG